MRFTTRAPSFVLLVAAALVALLALLATLQYRWLGQVSAGERERMQTNLRASTARFTKRRPEAIFSIMPLGWKSMSTITRVKCVSSLWKEITPLCDVPFVVFHAMRSFFRRWVISPSHCRRLNQIFSYQETLFRSSFLTLSTRCMNFGNSSNSVHLW